MDWPLDVEKRHETRLETYNVHPSNKIAENMETWPVEFQLQPLSEGGYLNLPK